MISVSTPSGIVLRMAIRSISFTLKFSGVDKWKPSSNRNPSPRGSCETPRALKTSRTQKAELIVQESHHCMKCMLAGKT